jgi:hypothetical protein
VSVLASTNRLHTRKGRWEEEDRVRAKMATTKVTILQPFKVNTLPWMYLTDKTVSQLKISFISLSTYLTEKMLSQL